MYPTKLRLHALLLLLSLSFTSIGQENPWQQIGPDMGYINGMALDQAHPDTIYAATPYGVYKTVDCAENWIKTNLAGGEINAVEVSLANPAIVVAISDKTVYKSEDYGETWNEIWNNELKIGAIALDPSSAMGIWAGVNVTEYNVYEENLYHSSDGGVQWEPVPFKTDEDMKLQTVLDIHFDRSDDSVIYVTGWGDTKKSDGGMFVSQDKGTTWTKFKLGTCSSNKVVGVATTPAGYEPHAAYALVGHDCGWEMKTYSSLDFGNSWEEVWNPFDATKHLLGGEVIEIDQDAPQWVMVGGLNNSQSSSVFLYNSVDDKWFAWSNSPHRFPSAILSHTGGNFLGFEDQGVFQNSLEDDSWTLKIKGMCDVWVLDIMPSLLNPDELMATVENSIASTTDGGENWVMSSSNYTKLEHPPGQDSVIYAGKKSRNSTFMQPFYCYKSEDGGESWESKRIFSNSGMLDYYYTLWIGDILMISGDPLNILMGVDGGGACGEGLYLSTNDGESWKNTFSSGVSALAMDPVNNDIVYLGTTALGYVQRSEDGGNSWSPISPTGQDALVGSVHDLGVTKSGQVFAATSDGLLQWEGGINWALVNGVPEGNTPAIVINNQPEKSDIYVGTESQGVFVSTDGGSTWEGFNSGLEKPGITRLKISETTPRYLYAGTINGGAWRTELPLKATRITELQKPGTAFTIYPNPNHGEFSIRSESNAVLKGTLRIMNLSGQDVYVDSDFSVSPNTSRNVKTGYLSPGCYLLIFKNDQQSITRKIMVH